MYAWDPRSFTLFPKI